MIRHAISKMPLAHFNVLRRVLEHLTVGSTHEDQTRMAEKQFSLVFGQTILTPPEQGGIKALNAGIQYGNRVVEVMLNHVSADLTYRVKVGVLMPIRSIMLFLKAKVTVTTMTKNRRRQLMLPAKCTSSKGSRRRTKSRAPKPSEKINGTE